jgi:hypothetical protein
MAEFPRCAMCRVGVKPGQRVMFRSDGRVAHVDCPEVTCPVCTRQIFPGDPIRRNGEEMLHGNCWLKRQRAMAGGSAASPWTIVFEQRWQRRGSLDPAPVSELRAAAREVCVEARALRRFARLVCWSSRALREESAVV